MTDDNNPTAPDAPVAPSTDPATSDAPDLSKVRAEAARYRKRAQEAEAERDALRSQVDSLHRDRIEQLAVGRLDDPADVWLVHDTAAFLGDDGALDPDRAAELLDALADERPHWKPRPATPPTTRPAPVGGLDPTTSSDSPSWSDVIAR